MIAVRVLAMKPHPDQATHNPGCWAVQLHVTHKGNARTFWRWFNAWKPGPGGQRLSTNEAPLSDDIVASFWKDTFAELHGFNFESANEEQHDDDAIRRIVK